MRARQRYSGVENLEVMKEAKNYNAHLLSMVREHVPPGGRVLDFGAGTGQFAAPLRQAGFDITAIEPDEFLRQRLTALGINALATLHGLPDHSIDFIYSLNVLEHIEDDISALEQLHSKLVPPGRLLIYVPAFPVLYTSMDARVGHVRRYTRGTLLRQVTSAGFYVRHVSYVDSIGFLATLLFKMLGDKQGTVNATALRIYDRFVFPPSIALDRVTRRLFGKNLLLIASKASD